MISNKLPSKFFNFISIEKRTVEFKKTKLIICTMRSGGSELCGWMTIAKIFWSPRFKNESSSHCHVNGTLSVCFTVQVDFGGKK